MAAVAGLKHECVRIYGYENLMWIIILAIGSTWHFRAARFSFLTQATRSGRRPTVICQDIVGLSSDLSYAFGPCLWKAMVAGTGARQA